MQTDMYNCKLPLSHPPSQTLPTHSFPFHRPPLPLFNHRLHPSSVFAPRPPAHPIISPPSLPLSPRLYICLFQVSSISLDGLFDAEQHRGQPLIQTRDRVELLHGLCERLAVLLLVGF